VSVVGLDPSSTATGICAAGITLTVTAKGDLLTRARAMRDEVRHWCTPTPDLVVIEAIGTRHVQTAIAIATVHALVLDQLDNIPVQMVAPAVLKRWATGNGNANKDAMFIAAIRAGSSCETNDEADAWWLYALGEATRDVWVIPHTEYRHTVLNTLKVTA
jgi:Holliday junction resolvasome RuvABC endonuclease subunit